MFGSLIPNLEIWIQDSGAAGYESSMAYFFLEDKDKKIEDWFDPQLDSAIQPKARGLLHMEREFIVHHIKEDDSGLEHLIASKQPKKYSKD